MLRCLIFIFIFFCLDQITELKRKLNSVEDLIATNEKQHHGDLREANQLVRRLEATNIELQRENEVIYEEKLAAEKLVVVWKK